jgi:hypothetical protein
MNQVFKKSLKFSQYINRTKTTTNSLLTPAHLNTEYHTAEVAEVEPEAAVHHSQLAAGTVGTSDLKKKIKGKEVV